jgi:hypothetical protein
MGQQNLPHQPEWLKNHKPPPGDGRGNPNWKKGGPSPNPSGRPAEHGVAKVKLASQIIDSASDILDVMIQKAKEGDSSAAQLVLSRIMAPLKASGERVQFDFDPSLPISQQVEQVLAAVAAGEVPPDVGQQIITAIAALSSIRDSEELERRLALLQAKEVNP